jgi:hypothetical protein
MNRNTSPNKNENITPNRYVYLTMPILRLDS